MHTFLLLLLISSTLLVNLPSHLCLFLSFSYHLQLSLSLFTSLSPCQLVLSLFLFSMTMTMVNRSVGSLCALSAMLECMDLGPFVVW